MPARLLLAIAVAAAACTSTATTTTAPRVEGTTTGAPPTSLDLFAPPDDLPRLGSPTAAVVTNVLDGDSMEVTIDGEADEIRLLGINAPEGDECLGDVSRVAMQELVEGKEVSLFGDERDRFGRLLVLVEVDGTPVGWRQVRTGLALALTTEHPRLSAYGLAEDDAFIDGLGMWAPDACGPATSVVLGIDEIQWDAPGPDGDNRNEEFVVISNDGNPVDMTGWVLRDESTRWRYEFPDGFMLGDEVTVRTGCGDDDSDDLFWCANDPLWTNAGDTAILLDPSGNVVARVSYGAKTER